MTYPANIQDMIDDFAFLDDWEDRYMHVIDLGKGLDPLPLEAKIDQNKVKGCASQVWLLSTQTDGIWSFSGDSDAHIVKGANDILSKLGLAEHLSAQRSNGLAAMIGRIKGQAAA